MNRAHWILLLLWGLFGLLHSLLAAGGVKRYFALLLGRYAGYYRLFYSLFAFLSLGVVVVAQFSIKSIPVATFSLLKYLVGLTVGAPGVILMIICIRKYFFHLSGVKILFGEDERARLETGGVHAYVRHPLYLGTLATLWSVFFFFPLLSHLVACLSITVYTFIGIRLEEKKLLRVFGEAYADYRRRTPMLIPNFPLR